MMLQIGQPCEVSIWIQHCVGIETSPAMQMNLSLMKFAFGLFSRKLTAEVELDETHFQHLFLNAYASVLAAAAPCTTCDLIQAY